MKRRAMLGDDNLLSKLPVNPYMYLPCNGNLDDYSGNDRHCTGYDIEFIGKAVRTKGVASSYILTPMLASPRSCTMCFNVIYNDLSKDGIYLFGSGNLYPPNAGSWPSYIYGLNYRKADNMSIWFANGGYTQHQNILDRYSGQRINIIAIRDGQHPYLLINGIKVLDDNTTMSTYTDSSIPVIFGGILQNGAIYYPSDAIFDNIIVYDRVLTTHEISMIQKTL